jgi:hypothetical protein
MELITLADLMSGRSGVLAVGDVLAFRGISKVDEFIQDASLSGISHVAIVIREDAASPLSILESTGAGVTVTPVDKAVSTYQADHTCFYLPLSPGQRTKIDSTKLAAYYVANAKEKYNYAGVVAAGLYDIDNPLLGKLVTHLGGTSPLSTAVEKYESFAEGLWKRVFDWNQDYRRLFCSQLVTEALLDAGVSIPGPPNPRLVVPVEVCHFPIYGGAFQLNNPPPLQDPFAWGAAPV